MSEKRKKSKRKVSKCCTACPTDSTFGEAVVAAQWIVRFLEEHEGSVERAELSRDAEDNGISGLQLEKGKSLLGASIKTTRPFIDSERWEQIEPCSPFVRLLLSSLEDDLPDRPTPDHSGKDEDV